MAEKKWKKLETRRSSLPFGLLKLQLIQRLHVIFFCIAPVASLHPCFLALWWPRPWWGERTNCRLAPSCIDNWIYTWMITILKPLLWSIALFGWPGHPPSPIPHSPTLASMASVALWANGNGRNEKAKIRIRAQGPGATAPKTEGW